MFNDDDDERSARKSSLKGLLKAFKGKGELLALVQELREARIQLQQHQLMLKQVVYELPGRNVPLILCSNPSRPASAICAGAIWTTTVRGAWHCRKPFNSRTRAMNCATR